ncbi:MBL fold metallo-hydrolase [Chloroflexota bacterium]
MDLFRRKSSVSPYAIEKESLVDNSSKLTGFFFHQGGNIYVFSYKKKGTIKHTLIDAGDLYYRNYIFSILRENEINPANIENIIITHRHTDHSGLAYTLAKESRAKILVHSNFKSFIENDISPEERRWFGNFNNHLLSECDIVYLSGSRKSKVINIGGLDFPVLGKPVPIGKAGHLHILGVPENELTHTPDQLLALYSPDNSFFTDGNNSSDGTLPSDNIVFSGDLWLMTGPNYNRGIRNLHRRVRMYTFRIKALLSVGRIMHRNHREQDAAAKEALKKGFSLIRVKPGHGVEFLGSRIIPDGLLADRDIMIKLGYPENTDTSMLKTEEMADKVASLRDWAYTNFVKELHYWFELGYDRDEISSILLRIYKEQQGGTRQVKKARKQRRERLRATLNRLKSDKTEPGEIHHLAESTLAAL